MKTFEEFKSQYTKIRKDGSVRILSDYKEKFGDMTFEEAYEEEKNYIEKFIKRVEKRNQFEKFLINYGAKCEISNISESRYYYYNGVKYRFSSHIYPTGSMTNEIMKVVDLAADIHLIDNIVF